MREWISVLVEFKEAEKGRKCEVGKQVGGKWKSTNWGVLSVWEMKTVLWSPAQCEIAKERWVLDCRVWINHVFFNQNAMIFFIKTKKKNGFYGFKSWVFLLVWIEFFFVLTLSNFYYVNSILNMKCCVALRNAIWKSYVKI